MTPIIEKYIGKEAFNNALKTLKGNLEFEEVFASFLNTSLTELEEDDAIYEEEGPEQRLGIPINYMTGYIKLREQGLSKIWSDFYANLVISYDTKNAVFRCYEYVKQKDEALALKDLDALCSANNGDAQFKEFLIYNVSHKNYFEKSIIEVAAEYSKRYHEQIREGKTPVYAKKFASLVVQEYYHPLYCEHFAFIYDQSIQLGKDEDYALTYAEKYAEELVDIQRRAGISDDEERLDFARAKAKAYINAWEYSKANNLKNSSYFIESYEHAYLNTLFSDDLDLCNTIEECETIALKKAITAYNKRMN